MPESPRTSSGDPQVRGPRFTNPWSHLKRLRRERFERQRQELRAYLEVAAPLGLQAHRLYREWRETVSEPIQNGQKAANHSAVYWWQITDSLRRFEQLTPPGTARRYHRLFAEALRDASLGSEVAKNGFRINNYVEVSHGLGFLDRYVELMGQAERELGRLLRKYELGGESEGAES